jgi:hypothetical protein
LIDLAIYGRLKDVTVCYRCHTGCGAYKHGACFDLHTADVLEQEYERRLEGDDSKERDLYLLSFLDDALIGGVLRAVACGRLVISPDPRHRYSRPFRDRAV